MLLKKQTVWLLTMLSLVVVLSVYYLTAPPKQSSNLAATEQKEDKQQNETEQQTETKQETEPKEDEGEPAAEKESKSGAAVVTEQTSDDAFETLRMEIQDSRAKQKEELTLVMADTEISAEERSKAAESIKELSEIDEKEQIIESLIEAMNYDAALVRVKGTDVNITVKSEKATASAANNIIRLVNDELDGMHNVAVDFQPKK